MPEHTLAPQLAGEAGRFSAQLGDAARVQAAHLASIVKRNANTAFGRHHGFNHIDGPRRFAAQVPINDYAALEPWIDRAADGQPKELTHEAILAFEQTGGSTGGAKRVPCTASGLAEFQAGLRPWLDDLISAFPALATGSFYWSISPAVRPPAATRSGIPIGLGGDAAYFGDALAPSIIRSLAVDPDVAQCTDIDEWRQRTVTQLLGCADLAMMSVWSPTFLSQLLHELPADRWAQQWPRLSVINCWDQAASAPFAAALREACRGVFVQGKGLLATEGLVTIPLVGQAWPVLSPASGYFEFRDDDGVVHGIDGVRASVEYELIITNANGFYRYAIGDRVRVHGFVGQAPTLEFIGRGSASSDLCGEKLTECFTIDVLTPLGLGFSALGLDAQGSRYVLLVDADEALSANAPTLLARLERGLAHNPQYAYARRLGQLQPPIVHRLRQPMQRWTQVRLDHGQLLGNIKPPVLVCSTDLQALVAEAASCHRAQVA